MKLLEKERPRERLQNKGVRALNSKELLAILLRTGYKNSNVLDLSENILQEVTLNELSNMNVEELVRFKGISKAKATTLVSAFEIAKRSFLEEKNLSIKAFKSSQDVVNYVQTYFVNLKHERILCMFVSSKNTLIKEEIIQEGGIDFSLIDPRILIKRALEIQTSGFFIIHNHPSGDPTPSKEDRDITTQLKKISDYLGIRFLDHIVFGSSLNYYSFFDEGDI